MNKHNKAYVFKEPVNELEENCNNYYEIIKNPMDFATINGKLTSEYRSKDEFIKDLN